MFSAEKKVILASASPRRRQFFTDLGISFSILVSGFEEKHIPGETAENYVERNARQKAIAATGLCSPVERGRCCWCRYHCGVTRRAHFGKAA